MTENATDVGRTCAGCKNIGVQYWGDDWSPIHHCGKSTERRRAQFQSCGDKSQDFMNEFRKFYDAAPDQKACSLYEQSQEVPQSRLDVIAMVEAAGGRAVFKFWSSENDIATSMRDRYLRDDTRNDEYNGFRAYKITKLGRAALAASKGSASSRSTGE